MARIEKQNDLAIKPLEKMLMGICGRKGYTPDAVFEGLLDYIIGYLNPSLTPQPIEGWKFSPDDTPIFAEMMQAVIECYNTEIPRRGWYDPFGDLYMAIHAGGNGKGQFFTPSAVANVVAATEVHGMKEPKGYDTPFGHRITISDCAAGSGRMPLAGYCELLKVMQNDWHYTPVEAQARRPYISCEDLDYNCVKMSAINLAFHGCFGECVCHDSLTEPEAVRLGYIINETMYPFPNDLPSIRKESNPLRFVSTKLFALRKMANEKAPALESEAKQAEPVSVQEEQEQPKPNERKQPQQLELW